MTLTMLTFLAQLMIVPCFRHIRKGVAKTMLEDAYHTICFIGDVNVWRGVWNLLNIYLVPGEPRGIFLKSVLVCALYRGEGCLVAYGSFCCVHGHAGVCL